MSVPIHRIKIYVFVKIRDQNPEFDFPNINFPNFDTPNFYFPNAHFPNINNTKIPNIKIQYFVIPKKGLSGLASCHRLDTPNE